MSDEIEARDVAAVVIRLQVDTPHHKPVWPDDDLTRDWLAVIAAARAAANK